MTRHNRPRWRAAAMAIFIAALGLGGVASAQGPAPKLAPLAAPGPHTP